MVKNCLKSHFTLKHLSPLHHSATVFTVSQWQFDKSQSSIIYLLYRTLVAAFIITTWCLVLDTPSFGIYFTLWGYTLCALQFLLAFILQLSAFLLTRVFEKSRVLDFILKLYPLYWILHVAATTAGFIITIIFWGALWTNDMAFTAKNFYVHGSNSIVLMIDLWIIGHPVRILHVIYPLLFGTAYVIFNIAYYYYDVNRGGPGYIYIIMNWGEPLMATLVVLGILILTILLHLLTFGIHVVKLLIHNRIYPQNIQPGGNPTQSTEQLSGGAV